MRADPSAASRRETIEISSSVSALPSPVSRPLLASNGNSQARVDAGALVNATRVPSGETAAAWALAGAVVRRSGVRQRRLTGSTGTRHRVGTPSLKASTINAVPAGFQLMFSDDVGIEQPERRSRARIDGIQPAVRAIGDEKPGRHLGREDGKPALGMDRARGPDGATELGFENSAGGLAAVGCDDERRVGHVAVHEHDLAAIGHPRGAPSVWRDSPHGTTVDVDREEATAVILGTKDETLAIGRPGRLRLVSRRTRHSRRVAAIDALHPDVEVPVPVPRVGYPPAVG